MDGADGAVSWELTMIFAEGADVEDSTEFAPSIAVSSNA
jgi:hypothetical protein